MKYLISHKIKKLPAISLEGLFDKETHVIPIRFAGGGGLMRFITRNWVCARVACDAAALQAPPPIQVPIRRPYKNDNSAENEKH